MGVKQETTTMTRRLVQGGYQAPSGNARPKLPTIGSGIRSAQTGEFGEHHETITVYDIDLAPTVDTRVLDASGRPIHRRLVRPIGFVIFGEA